MHKPSFSKHKGQLKKAATSRMGRVVFWVVSLCVAALLGITLWLNIGLAPTVRQQLEAKVSTATQGKYRLTIGRVGISFLTSSIGFHRVALEPTRKSASDKQRVKVEVRSVQMKNIKWREYLSDAKVQLKGIYINEPNVVFVQQKDTGEKQRTAQKTDLAELLGQLRNEIDLQEIVVDKGRIAHTVVTPEGKRSQQSADDIRIVFRNVRLPAKTDSLPADPASFLEKAEFSLKNYRFAGANSLYELKAQQATLHADRRLEIQSVQFGPRVSDREFVRLSKVQKDLFRLQIPQIICRDLNVRQALQSALVMRSIQVTNPVLKVYRDKRMPPRKKRPLMPNEAIRGIPFRVRIDSAIVSGASITYSEQMPKVSVPGKISFEKSSIKATNLTNDPRRMTSRTPLVVRASTMLMNEGRMNLTLATNLLSSQFDLAYQGYLDKMPIEAFNRMSLPNENIRVADGWVERVSFSSNVRHGVARGWVKPIYEDLKIEVFDPEKQKKQGMLTLLGNIALRTSNLEDERKSARSAPILYRRQPDDSFIAFLWQSVRTGLLAAVTPVNVDKVKTIRQKVGRKQEPKAKARKDSTERKQKAELKRLPALG